MFSSLRDECMTNPGMWANEWLRISSEVCRECVTLHGVDATRRYDGCETHIGEDLLYMYRGRFTLFFCLLLVASGGVGP